ncbi:MAG TPA: hypothetical protein VLB29_11175 [Nocardioidaceae bacterium]|nr:hypothetical protein [Nocardioidaceae bacterium]
MNGQRDDEYGSLNDLMGSFEDPVDPDTDAPRPTEPDSVESDSGESDLAAADWVPAGLPPEYLEAFRRGYERARRGEEATVALEHELAASLETDRAQPAHDDEVDSAPEPAVSREPEDPAAAAESTALVEVREQPREESAAASAGHEPTVTIPAVKAAPPPYDEGPDAGEERRWLPVPLLALAGVALVLILAAFGVGRLFAGDGDSDEGSSASSSGADSSGGGDSQGQQAPYDGPVDAVPIAGGNATCQAAQSVDAAGTPATYEPAKAFDSDLSTAWRCDGSGKGQRFTITLPQETTVAELGMVPGYAKTDPVSGADRYAENNRITKVRWRFDDGTTFVQRMKGSAADRSMRTIRIPETSTTTLVIEILRSKPGPRNTVAISEIRVATPAG